MLTKEQTTVLDPYWEMDWTKYKKDDPRGIERVFEGERALAILLINDVVFLNSYWGEDGLPADFKKRIAIYVNANDIAAWGMADAEDINYSELQSLYDLWLENNTWGPVLWVCNKRGQMPQWPMYKDILEKYPDFAKKFDTTILKQNQYDKNIGRKPEHLPGVPD